MTERSRRWAKRIARHDLLLLFILQSATAAILIHGYTIGNRLLENSPFVDNAFASTGDSFYSSGNTGSTEVIAVLWNINATVSISSIALRIRNDSDTSNIEWLWLNNCTPSAQDKTHEAGNAVPNDRKHTAKGRGANADCVWTGTNICRGWGLDKVAASWLGFGPAGVVVIVPLPFVVVVNL